PCGGGRRVRNAQKLPLHDRRYDRRGRGDGDNGDRPRRCAPRRARRDARSGGPRPGVLSFFPPGPPPPPPPLCLPPPPPPTAAPPLLDGVEVRVEPSLTAGIFQSLVNPKAYAAMAALFSGFVLVRGEVALDAAVKLGVVTTILVIVNVAWLKAGAAMTRFFRD